MKDYDQQQIMHATSQIGNLYCKFIQSLSYAFASELGQDMIKVIWSVGKGSEIFRENSHLFDFHLKAYYVCNMRIIHLKCA